MREIIRKHATMFAIASTLAVATATPSLAQYADAGVPTQGSASYYEPRSIGPADYGPGYVVPADGDWRCNCVGRSQLVRAF